jgi:hypothetical protein
MILEILFERAETECCEKAGFDVEKQDVVFLKSVVKIGTKRKSRKSQC